MNNEHEVDRNKGASGVIADFFFFLAHLGIFSLGHPNPTVTQSFHVGGAPSSLRGQRDP